MQLRSKQRVLDMKLRADLTVQEPDLTKVKEKVLQMAAKAGAAAHYLSKWKAEKRVAMKKQGA